MAGRLRVYISGPISNGGETTDEREVEFNVGKACEFAYELNKRGYAFHLPHLTVFFEKVTGTTIDYEDWMDTDIAWVEAADAILRVPGQSAGADRECEAALAVGIPVFTSLDALDVWANAPELDTTQEIEVVETVLDEAQRITTADRGDQYGPPEEHFARTAALWSAFFEHRFEPADVAKAMVMDKLSRSANKPKRDHWVDIAGWAACGFRTENGHW